MRFSLEADGYRYVRSIVERKPYFGPRHASGQGDPVRHAYMAAVVRMLAAAGRRRVNILEVGSWAGGSTVTWARALDECDLDGHVYCVDHWKQQFDLEQNTAPVYAAMVRAVSEDAVFRLFQHNIACAGVASRVVIIRGGTAETLPVLADRAYDVVFVDASHMYEDVRYDLCQGRRLLADGGVLCGDDLELQSADCDEAGMRRAIELGQDYISDSQAHISYHPGVTRAVGEVLGNVHAWHGFWAVQRIGDAWIGPSLPPVEPEPPAHLRSAVTDGDVRSSFDADFVVLDGPDGAIAIREGVAPDDLLSMSRQTWQNVPLVVAARDAEEVRRRLQFIWPRRPGPSAATEKPPTLVVADRAGYNIVHFRDQYFAVSQALGPLDLAQVDLGQMVAAGIILAAPTQRETELMVAGIEALAVGEHARSLEERVGSLQELLAASRQQVASLDAAVAALSEQLGEQKRQLAEAERRTSTATAQHEAAMATQRPRWETLQAQLDHITSDLRTAKQELTISAAENAELRQWIDELHRRVATGSRAWWPWLRRRR